MESWPDYFKQYGMFHSSIVSIYYHTCKKHEPCKCRSRATQVWNASRASVEQEPCKRFSLYPPDCSSGHQQELSIKIFFDSDSAGIIFSNSSYSQIKTIH